LIFSKEDFSRNEQRTKQTVAYQ